MRPASAKSLPVTRSVHLGGRARITAFAGDVGSVLYAWLLLLLAENIVVGSRQKAFFSATWELSFAHKLVTPIALGALLPCACVAVAAGRMARGANRSREARAACAIALAVAGAAVALGVSHGRHLASPTVRVPFVTLVAVAGAAVGGWAAPWLAAKMPDRRWVGLAGAAGAAALWCADVGVLPGLYPAFHDALLVALLASAALASLAWRAPGGQGSLPAPSRWVVALPMLLAALASALAIPRLARSLRGADNLRVILIEHAPLLGRAVRLAAWLAPPPPLDALDASPEMQQGSAGEIPRALDWTGHDVLLLSVDALRADHASAYGYARATTPSLDALAREGTLFESAYCPTPHTSYSITSMMTGKAMRPLLSLGLGGDSETWARALRRYGYRTAAFYPPAVFFIDEERFRDFESSGLDFEYRKVEFASAQARVGQVDEYLKGAPSLPLFLWVHLFEPHEPYEARPDHPMGPLPIDAYDSEIAEADEAIGRIARRFRAERPGAVILVTADHGEEFGEHGGHYHGTSCYEEQVHVPLVVVGPGVLPQRVRTVVQTIDLLPTVLSALGIPRPARVRGRDLGPLLAGKAPADAGLAYAETDEYTLLARGDDRLVCARKIGACTLFDVAHDPKEQHDRSAAAPEVTAQLRRMAAANERDQGRFEGAGGTLLPEALRRGLQGEVDAAEDVATLLDDANLPIRRQAALVLYRLHPATVAASLRRALAHDEDPEVRSWCALALVRIGEPAPAGAAALLADPSRDLRRHAALAFAEQGDARGAAELAAWWADEAPPRQGLDVEMGRELLVAMARIHDTAAVPALVASLSFVPLRPWIADALGAIGDRRARAPLLAALREERYVTARPREAAALLRLDVRAELRAPLARFAGVPEPMLEAVAFAREAGVLRPEAGGIAFQTPEENVSATLAVPTGQPLRLLALAGQGGTPLSGTFGEARETLREDRSYGNVHVVELAPSRASTVSLQLQAPGGLLGVWVVPHAADVPPPAPVAFEAGAPAPDDAGRPQHLN
jgi:HEAT repeat protein